MIVVNDTIGTEYFVTIDTQNKNFELIPVKFNDNGNSRGSVAKYFANIQYLDEPNQGKIGSKFQAGYPAYFAFINGNCIIKDMIFDRLICWCFLMKKLYEKLDYGIDNYND